MDIGGRNGPQCVEARSHCATNGGKFADKKTCLLGRECDNCLLTQ